MAAVSGSLILVNSSQVYEHNGLLSTEVIFYMLLRIACGSCYDSDDIVSNKNSWKAWGVSWKPSATAGLKDLHHINSLQTFDFVFYLGSNADSLCLERKPTPVPSQDLLFL